MLLIASEQASCRLSKPALVKVKTSSLIDWSFKVDQRRPFQSSGLTPEASCESPHGPAQSGPEHTGSDGHLQLRNEW